MEELADYCVEVEQEGEDLLLEMTEEHKASPAVRKLREGMQK